jgi:hypothetical protein
VLVEHPVNRLRRRVQAVIAFGLGEVADAGDVTIGRIQPAAGTALLRGVLALDGLVSPAMQPTAIISIRGLGFQYSGTTGDAGSRLPGRMRIRPTSLVKS